MSTNNLTAQIEEARKAGDWEKHAQLWEQRRVASVDADESALKADFVIRSMSTTDYRPAMRCGTTIVPEQKPQPYHIYLKPIGQRAGAYWANHIVHAMRFANVADAQAEANRISLTGYEISAVDDPTTYWGNREALRSPARAEA